MHKKAFVVAAALFTFAIAGTAPAQSVFTQKLDEPAAVVLSKEKFPDLKADGVSDDSAVVQQAVDQARRGRILLIPEGRYCIGKTIYVWSGIRVIGYGAKRPVFVLAPNTPGFQERDTNVGPDRVMVSGPDRTGLEQGRGRYMFHFTDSAPNANQPLSDGTDTSFYCGMNNIDFEVGAGNPAAVCIRFHIAQHGALVHMDFKLDGALAALEDIGNEASDLHIHGGQYGIISKRTAPVWQFLLMDSTFDNQTVAGIHTQEVGFTLVRCNFSHMPVGIEIPSTDVEQLYGRDLRMEDIKNAAIKLGDDKNMHEAVTLENTACADVPHFLVGTEKINNSSKYYVVDHVAAGLEIGQDGREVGVVTRHKEHSLRQPAPVVPSDIPSLPPMDQWVNVKNAGVQGTGDDGPAFQAAVNSNRVLFIPAGNYRISTPLMLRPDTVLIALHPASTTLTMTGAGDSNTITGVFVAPPGGSNIVTGLGVTPGSPRVAGVLWLAGSNSMLEDVSFANRNGGGGRGGRGGFGGGGGGGGAAPGRGGNATPVAPDLLVRDGGGGIFRDLWAHATASGLGLLAENTSTPTTIYQLSNEHHPRVEVQFHNVQNWTIYCLQTEEENPAGADAISVEIQNSRHLLFADTDMYRVSRNVRPKEFAVEVTNSDDITFDNVHVFSQTRLAFDTSVWDQFSGVTVRPHDFTHFVIHSSTKKPAPLPLPSVFAKDAKLAKLASGFSNAAGLAADDTGRVYFTDAVEHKIYAWNEAAKTADVIAQLPNNRQPHVISFVKPSTLLIFAFERVVYSLDLKGSNAPQEVAPTPIPKPGTVLLLPVGIHYGMESMQDMMQHRSYGFRGGVSGMAVQRLNSNEARDYYYAPGSTTALFAGGTGRPITESCQLAAFAPGDHHYLTSEDDARTWDVTLEANGTLDTKLFAERGGNSVVADSAGNVYIAGGHVYIYNKQGKQIGTLEIPERASSLAFGGPDNRTLFIGARSSLYAIHTIAPGE